MSTGLLALHVPVQIQSSDTLLFNTSGGKQGIRLVLKSHSYDEVSGYLTDYRYKYVCYQ